MEVTDGHMVGQIAGWIEKKVLPQCLREKDLKYHIGILYNTYTSL